METIEAIAQRRSIRKFKETGIERESIEKIINAAILAPSAKNRQPWRFVVVTDTGKTQMLRAFRNGIEKAKAGQGLLSGAQKYAFSAEHTARIMEQAPVTIFILNPDGKSPLANISIDERFFELADTQSIGAAIQNMSLAAVELGLGSLWICDVFFAYQELCQWLNTEAQLVAALSIGYADEQPGARPRKPLEELICWR